MAGEDIEYRLRALEDDSKRNSDQHREFYAAFKTLETRNAVTEERYSTILATIAETRAAVEELKSKPARRWEAVVEKVILLVVAGVVGFALARLGLT